MCQELRFSPPGCGDDRSDVSLHRLPVGVVLDCHVRIQPFCDEPQPLRFPGAEVRGVQDMVKAKV